MVYSSDGDVASSVIDAMMAKISLELSVIPWFNVTKMVLLIFDLFDYDPDFHALANSFLRTVNVNFSTTLFNSFDDLSSLTCRAFGSMEAARGLWGAIHAFIQLYNSYTPAQYKFRSVDGSSFVV